ncbi:MAG TPA: hypothetical protein VGR26_15715 [Acidimicrobiales bacterium]|nr:hypothetical protein [Acidimicrobiales bacterium]
MGQPPITRASLQRLGGAQPWSNLRKVPSTSQGLAETAQKYARRAVSYFIDNDHSDFYLAAGVALEHAMKARLAREDVLFIAPANDFRSAVALWRTADNFQSLPFGTRTVSGADAVARVTILDKNFAPHSEAATHILRCRNGEAHIGAPGSTEHEKDFANFLASIESLSEGSSDEFWGQHVDLVRVTLDQNAAQVAKEVTQKIGVARGNYSRRFESLDDEQRRGLFAFIEQQVDAGLSDDVLRAECPACSGPALLYGENSVEFDIDVDHRSGAIIGAGQYVEFRAAVLRCGACTLHLVSEEELDAAKVDRVFANDGVDVDDYMRRDYDPFELDF